MGDLADIIVRLWLHRQADEPKPPRSKRIPPAWRGLGIADTSRPSEDSADRYGYGLPRSSRKPSLSEIEGDWS